MNHRSTRTLLSTRHQKALRQKVRTVCVLLAALAAFNIHAQSYPVKAVRVVVPLAPSGSTDVLTRLLAAKLTETWGQQVIVDNRGGAGTTIGTDIVARSPADGYTLLMATSAYAVNFSLFEKVPYKPTDFTPITNVAQTPNVLIVHPSIPAKSVKELISLLRARPGEIAYGSGGAGGSTHLAGELFKQLAKVDVVHVPYKGGGVAVAHVVSGEVALGFGNLTSVVPFAKAGRLRTLAVASAKRSPLLPELPTMAEAGVPGFQASTWNGLIAPAATPKDIVAKLNADVVKALRAPDMREKLTAAALEPIADTPAEFGAFIAQETARWAKVVKTAGLKPE